MVHFTKNVVVMDVGWVSAADDDVVGDFPVLEVPPSIRGSVEICSLGGTPSPRIQGFGGRSSTSDLVGLEPKPVGFAPKHVGMNP